LNFAREGYPFIGIATVLAVAAFALALWLYGMTGAWRQTREP